MLWSGMLTQGCQFGVATSGQTAKQTQEDPMATTKHLGAYHCGAVRFAISLDLEQGASRCNCSICTKVSAIGAIAKPEAFTLLSDEGALSVHEWGAKISRRYFCKACGVHCFASGDLPELGGAFVSVNVNALEDIDPSTIKVSYWDGRHNNWEVGPRATPWPIHSAAA